METKQINNDIQEDYCSFEVSKLLKEKGFTAPVITCFDDDNGEIISSYSHNVFHRINYNVGGGYKTSRPTHSLAIKWIRENFGYHITSCLSLQGYYYPCIQMTDGEYLDIVQILYKKPEESIESALLYTLKNLIK